MRDLLAVIGWSVFWILAVLGLAAVVIEWHALQRIFGA